MSPSPVEVCVDRIGDDPPAGSHGLAGVVRLAAASLEKLKEITSVKVQLSVGWTFPYQGYTGTCNSGPQNATIKLQK